MLVLKGAVTSRHDSHGIKDVMFGGFEVLNLGIDDSLGGGKVALEGMRLFLNPSLILVAAVTVITATIAAGRGKGRTVADVLKLQETSVALFLPAWKSQPFSCWWCGGQVWPCP